MKPVTPTSPAAHGCAQSNPITPLTLCILRSGAVFSPICMPSTRSMACAWLGHAGTLSYCGRAICESLLHSRKNLQAQRRTNCCCQGCKTVLFSVVRSVFVIRDWEISHEPAWPPLRSRSAPQKQHSTWQQHILTLNHGATSDNVSSADDLNPRLIQVLWNCKQHANSLAAHARPISASFYVDYSTNSKERRHARSVQSAKPNRASVAGKTVSAGLAFWRSANLPRGHSRHQQTCYILTRHCLATVAYMIDSASSGEHRMWQTCQSHSNSNVKLA